MKQSLISISALIIISAVMLNNQHCTLAQSSNKEVTKGQIDNNARLRALMNELQNTVTTLRKERQAYYSKKQEKDLEIQGLRIQIQTLGVTQEELVNEVKDNKNEMVWPVGGSLLNLGNYY